MKSLNKEAEQIFRALYKEVTGSLSKEDNSKRGHAHKRIDNTENTFMPVVVEVMETSKSDESPKQEFVSIAHYGQQNGDPMADPEMCFFEYNDHIYPFYFKNSYLGVEQTSVFFKDGVPHSFKPNQQSDHAEFASIWMQNIKEQQGIEAKSKNETDMNDCFYPDENSPQ